MINDHSAKCIPINDVFNNDKSLSSVIPSKTILFDDYPVSITPVDLTSINTHHCESPHLVLPMMTKPFKTLKKMKVMASLLNNEEILVTVANGLGRGRPWKGCTQGRRGMGLYILR